MKLAMFAFVAIAFACHAVSARSENRPAGPAGYCPEVDGPRPVYLPDVKNRVVYYKCCNGKPEPRKCRKNEVFNPINDRCEKPSTTAKPCGPVSDCPFKEGPMPTMLRDGCNVAVFYICEERMPVRRNCDGNLIFDPYKNSCVAPRR